MSNIQTTQYAPHLLGALRIVAGVLFLAHGLVKVAGFPEGAQPG
jgi:putative oxidoreductase